MTAQLGPLVVDAADPARVAAFWSAAIGETARLRYLRFRPEPQAKSVKNRTHLDLTVDAASGVERLIDLGARILADHSPEWTTLADVEGNELCAFPATGPTQVFAVCTDSDRPEQLAAWWAERVGARVGPGPDHTPRWLYGARGWEAVIWKFVRVDDRRVCPDRWRWSVTGSIDELIAAGATPVSGDEFVDPQTNAFSAASAPSSPAD